MKPAVVVEPPPLPVGARPPKNPTHSKNLCISPPSAAPTLASSLWRSSELDEDETDRPLSMRTIADLMYTITLEKNEPNALKSHSGDEVNRVVAPLEWREEPEPVMATSEKVKMHPAADSGSVDHCTHPKDLPKSVRVTPPGRPRGFVGAKGDDIDHYGSAEVTLEQTDGQEINCTMQLADVCRPLHSVSKIAGNAGDMFFKKNCAYVVPEGVFDEILAVVRHLAKYPRKGGLYVA